MNELPGPMRRVGVLFDNAEFFAEHCTQLAEDILTLCFAYDELRHAHRSTRAEGIEAENSQMTVEFADVAINTIARSMREMHEAAGAAWAERVAQRRARVA